MAYFGKVCQISKPRLPVFAPHSPASCYARADHRAVHRRRRSGLIAKAVDYRHASLSECRRHY